MVYIKAFLLQSISSLLDGFFLCLIYKHLSKLIKGVICVSNRLKLYYIGSGCIYILFTTNKLIIYNLIRSEPINRTQIKFF